MKNQKNNEIMKNQKNNEIMKNQNQNEMKQQEIKQNKQAFNALLKEKGIYEIFYEGLSTAMINYDNFSDFAKAFSDENNINLKYVKKVRTFIIDNNIEAGGFEPTLNSKGSCTRKPRKSGGSTNLEKIYEILNEFVATHEEFEGAAQPLIDALSTAVVNERAAAAAAAAAKIDKKIEKQAKILNIDAAALRAFLLQQQKATE